MVPEGITEGVYGEARGNLIDRSMSEEEIKALFDEGMSEAGVDVADFKPVITTDDTDAAKQFATFTSGRKSWALTPAWSRLPSRAVWISRRRRPLT